MLSALVIRTLARRAPIYVQAASKPPIFTRSLFSSASLLYATVKSAKSPTRKAASASPKKTPARPSVKKSVKAKAKPKTKSKVQAKTKRPSRAKPREFTDPPKKSPTSFILFILDNIPKFTTVADTRAYFSGRAAKWRTMTDEEKSPYINKALELRDQHKRDQEEWVKTTSATGLRQHRKLVRARRAKRILKDSKGQPVKPPPTTFQAFFQENAARFKLATDTSSDNLERMKRAGRAWQALSADEKAIYQKRYSEALDGYRKRSEQLRARH